MIRIKKYEEKFNSQVGKLHVQTFKEIGQKVTDWEEMCKQNIPCLIAVNGKEDVIGYAIYQIYNSVLFFNWFGVTSKLRGNGIGQKLLREVIKKAKEGNAKIIEVRSRNCFSSALCLYLKNDFLIEGSYLQNDKEMMIVLRKRNLNKKKI